MAGQDDRVAAAEAGFAQQLGQGGKQHENAGVHRDPTKLERLEIEVEAHDTSAHGGRGDGATIVRLSRREGNPFKAGWFLPHSRQIRGKISTIAPPPINRGEVARGLFRPAS